MICSKSFFFSYGLLVVDGKIIQARKSADKNLLPTWSHNVLSTAVSLSVTSTGIVLIGQVHHVTNKSMMASDATAPAAHEPNNTEVKRFSPYVLGKRLHWNEWAVSVHLALKNFHYCFWGEHKIKTVVGLLKLHFSPPSVCWPDFLSFSVFLSVF